MLSSVKFDLSGSECARQYDGIRHAVGSGGKIVVNEGLEIALYDYQDVHVVLDGRSAV